MINKHGFFLQTDVFEKIDQNFIEENKIEVPKGENILVFRGIASQSFGKGEVSRNGYKIDPKGWQLENYLKNPQILLMHNGNEPIGKAVSVSITKNGLEIVFFVNLDWVKEDADKNRLRDGAFSTLSTGHITLDYAFENVETGEILTEEEAEKKYGLDKWDLLWGDAWNFVVTKADLIEVSFVSTPSNPDALTERNALELFKNSICPKEKEEKNEEENIVSKNVVETVAENATATSENDEADAEKNNILEKKVSEIMEQNTVLQNQIAELEKTVELQKNFLKDSANVILNQSEKIQNLNAKINATPVLRGVAFKSPSLNQTGLGKILKSL